MNREEAHELWNFEDPIVTWDQARHAAAMLKRMRKVAPHASREIQQDMRRMSATIRHALDAWEVKNR